MQLGTALNLPNPRINFGGSGAGSGKGKTAIFSFETGVLDPKINFSRTTNATVTNSAGLITYAPHNLLTFSEQFDNGAWNRTNVTITANAIAAPDGTLTADKVEATTTAATLSSRSYTSVVSSQMTYSIYAKKGSGANEANSFAIYNITTALLIASGNIDYDTGVISGTNLGVTSENVGDGWWRIKVTPPSGLSIGNNIIVYFGFTGNTVTAGKFCYVWGAQLEIGPTATTYNSTTVKNLLGYSELFDNAAWTKSNSFVQTNLLTYSEAFDNAVWAKTTVTATANSIAAPNGYQTADTLLAAGANSTALQTFTASAVPYTFSIYLYRKTGTGNIDITVDGTTWVTKVITAGWTRVDTTLTPAAGSKTAGIRIVTSGDEIYAWGAQLVQGSVAGDYRRTDAAALPVYYPNHNGVVCAEKIVDGTANNIHGANQPITTYSPSGKTYIVSYYAKKAELNYVTIGLSDVSVGDRYAVAVFNLDTGVLTTSGASGVGYAIVGTPSISPVGNGWYRCSVICVAGTTVPFLSAVIGTNKTGVITAAAGGFESYTGTNAGIYIFGAQLSDSASLDPYVLNAAAAPTAAAYYGARFDYDPVTLAPKGLLIEEQRSNLILYSDQFDNAVWAKELGSITSTSELSPSGLAIADVFTETATSGIHGARNSTAIVTTIGTTVTGTIFLKKGTRRYAFLSIYDGLLYNSVVVDLNTATITSTDGTIAHSSVLVSSNGFVRIAIGCVQRSTTNTYLYWGTSDSATPTYTSGRPSFLGSASETLIVWGAQLEAGAFATSYIPTAASQVTRAADVATIQGSNFYSWYNQNEGSFSVNYLTEFSGVADTTRYVLSLDNSASKRVIYYGAGGEIATCFDGSTIITSGVDTTGLNAKLVSAYNPSNRYIAANNNAVASGSVVSTYSYSASLNISSPTSLCGWIKSISYYPQKLSDSVLKGLTA